MLFVSVILHTMSSGSKALQLLRICALRYVVLVRDQYDVYVNVPVIGSVHWLPVDKSDLSDKLTLRLLYIVSSLHCMYLVKVRRYLL